MNEGDVVWVLGFYGPFKATIIAIDSRHKKVCVLDDARGFELVELSQLFTSEESCYMARVLAGYAKAAEETAAAASWMEKMKELKKTGKPEVVK